MLVPGELPWEGNSENEEVGSEKYHCLIANPLSSSGGKTQRKVSDYDLRVWVGLYGERHFMSCVKLYRLKSTLWAQQQTGRQCSWARNGVVCSDCLVPTDNLATEFCTRCAFQTIFKGSPTYITQCSKQTKTDHWSQAIQGHSWTTRLI